MSTRCLIGLEREDKLIRYIYCHHDGYIEGVGKVLKEHYNNRETIEKLLSLGDLSSLGDLPETNPELIHSYAEAFERWLRHPTEANAKLMEKALKESGLYCELLEGTQNTYKTVVNRKMYMEQQADAEYRYLFTRKGVWTVQKLNSDRFKIYGVK